MAKLVQWKRLLGLEINAISQKAIVVYSDNDATLRWTEPGFTRNPRNSDIRYHFCRDHTAQKIIEPKYGSTDKNVADLFTKTLPVYAHIEHSELIGIRM